MSTQHVCKLVVLGDSSVGKTSLIHNYINKEFIADFKATIGADFSSTNVTIDGKEIEECDAPEDYDCSADYQTCVVISIQGDLRDRTKEETQKEFNEFMKYITTKCYIRDYSVNIEGDC